MSTAVLSTAHLEGCTIPSAIHVLDATQVFLNEYVFKATQICDNVYLGCVWDAQKISVLRELGITHIVSILNKLVKPQFVNEFDYLTIEAVDDDNQELINQFDAVIAFVQKALQNKGKVLLHCAAGKSRSATIAIAYFMKTQRMTLDEALSSIRTKRPIKPNEGFMDQLRIYESMGCLWPYGSFASPSAPSSTERSSQEEDQEAGIEDPCSSFPFKSECLRSLMLPYKRTSRRKYWNRQRMVSLEKEAPEKERRSKEKRD